MSKKKTLNVDGTAITLLIQETEEYFSLTDIAKNFPVGVAAIESWMRNRNTVEFLGTWEMLYNPGFNSVGFDGIKMNVGLNTFKLSVKKWVEDTNAIGIMAKAGKHGGTYAHKDIAVQFCYWLSPVFQLYLIKEFQRLKEEERKQLQTQWNLKRQIVKANWYIHSEAVREHLVPMIDWNTKREAIAQASEADLLNLALFGLTSREWKVANSGKKGNMRDYASVEQLLILANLQSLNSKLLEWGSPKDQRLEILNKTAREQMQVLVATKALGEIKKLN